VKIGERWWVSGFTIEYNPGYDAQGQDYDILIIITDGLLKIMPDVQQRLKAGEFRTMTEYLTATQTSFMGYVMQHPEEFASLRGMDPKRLARMFSR
jgi:hypothetical protein